MMMTLCADRTMGEGAKRGKACSVPKQAMSGAVPCLSTDLTTRAVPHFIQALQMGRRAAPKARGADCLHCVTNGALGDNQ